MLSSQQSAAHRKSLSKKITVSFGQYFLLHGPVMLRSHVYSVAWSFDGSGHIIQGFWRGIKFWRLLCVDTYGSIMQTLASALKILMQWRPNIAHNALSDNIRNYLSCAIYSPVNWTLKSFSRGRKHILTILCKYGPWLTWALPWHRSWMSLGRSRSRKSSSTIWDTKAFIKESQHAEGHSSTLQPIIGVQLPRLYFQMSINALTEKIRTKASANYRFYVETVGSQSPGQIIYILSCI